MHLIKKLVFLNFFVKKTSNFELFLKLKQQLHMLKTKKDNRKQKLSCFITKRTRGVFSFFNLSRHQIKELIKKNILFGLIKSSW